MKKFKIASFIIVTLFLANYGCSKQDGDNFLDQENNETPTGKLKSNQKSMAISYIDTIDFNSDFPNFVDSFITLHPLGLIDIELDEVNERYILTTEEIGPYSDSTAAARVICRSLDPEKVQKCYELHQNYSALECNYMPGFTIWGDGSGRVTHWVEADCHDV